MKNPKNVRQLLLFTVNVINVVLRMKRWSRIWFFVSFDDSTISNDVENYSECFILYNLPINHFNVALY